MKNEKPVTRRSWIIHSWQNLITQDDASNQSMRMIKLLEKQAFKDDIAALNNLGEKVSTNQAYEVMAKHEIPQQLWSASYSYLYDNKFTPEKNTQISLPFQIFEAENNDGKVILVEIKDRLSTSQWELLKKLVDNSERSFLKSPIPKRPWTNYKRDKKIIELDEKLTLTSKQISNKMRDEYGELIDADTVRQVLGKSRKM